MTKRFCIGICILVLLVLGASVITKVYLVSKAPQQNQPVSAITQWKDYTFNEAGLTLSVPAEMQVSGEKTDDSTFFLIVQRSAYPKSDYYQLYGLFNFTDTSSINPEDLKSQLMPPSIVQTQVSGLTAVQGQYKGAPYRLVTFIIAKNGLFTLTTAQPTVVNAELTNSILKTFNFK